MSQCVLLLLGGGVLSVDVGSVYCVSADTRAMTVFTQVSAVITLTLCAKLNEKVRCNLRDGRGYLSILHNSSESESHFSLRKLSHSKRKPLSENFT